ncbi:hypothetical protein Dda_1587 [Drechslerella dactyloides]|uniref:RGS domain-containing protein n=1 Tax=Drechslerella dactyloides TaxID=74499 RepID=A0AAD6J3R1_DREDA|nr:hypothetical protein Dda_1587 [Drechslerella dactyloides]
MIDIFYRRPPSTYSDTSYDSTSFSENGKNAGVDGIPAKLSFENVVNGLTAPPCTLGDFSRYLRFSNMNEHADSLQFYLWVKRYTKKFQNELRPQEQALSPRWMPPVSKKVLGTPESSESQLSLSKTPSNSSYEVDDVSKVEFGEDVVLKPFTIQPFRSDIDQVTSLYLAPDAPLSLPLSTVEKADTLDALRRTTHPSAFSPAMRSIEISLRLTAHPSFIRHCLTNATGTRLSFLSVSGAILAIFAIFGLIALTLSSVSRWYRLLTFILLFGGLIMIANAKRGLCMVLVALGMARNLSPWEVYAVDDENLTGMRKARAVSDEESGKAEVMAEVTVLELDDEMGGKYRDEQIRIRWFVKDYNNRPVLSRVFERRVPIEDNEIRRLQLSILMQNAIITFVLTIIAETIFVVLPRGGFF